MKNAGYTIQLWDTVPGTPQGVAVAKGPQGMWVTWRIRKDEQETSYFWGNYHTDEKKAMADYDKRLAALYKLMKG